MPAARVVAELATDDKRLDKKMLKLFVKELPLGEKRLRVVNATMYE